MWTLRSSILSVTLVIGAARAMVLPADAEAASRVRETPISLSQRITAGAKERDPAGEAKLRWELARVLRDAGRGDEAIGEYRKALALDSRMEEARRELAQLLRSRGRPAEAAHEFLRLVRGRPGDAALRRELAETWVEAKQEDRAIGEFERLAAGRPSDLTVRRRLLDLYAGRGRWADLIGTARAILKRAPSDTQTRFHLANALVASQRAAEAVSHLRQVIRMDPGRRDAKRLLADALSWQGEYQEAAALYKELLEPIPRDVGLRLRLAESYRWSGRLDEAEREYRAALREAPQRYDARLGLGLTLQAARKTAEARALLESILRERPGEPEALDALAHLSLEQGRLEEAEGLLAQLAQLQPGREERRRRLAQVLALQGRLEEAIAEYQQLIRADPSNAEALEGLGAASVASQMPYRALEVYRRAVALRPKRREARLGVALALGVAGEYVAALRAYAAILSEDPKDARAWLGTAKVLTWAKRFEEAESWYLGAIRGFPGDPDVRLDYAAMLLAERRFFEAADMIRRAPMSQAEVTRATLVEADSLRHLGRAEEARGLLTGVAAQRPREPHLVIALGELALRQGQFGAAEEEFRRALSLQSDLVEARYGLWKAEGRGKDPDDVGSRFGEVQRGSGGARRLARLGELLAADGRFAQSARACAVAVALDPDLVGAEFTLAEAAAAQGDFQAAADTYLRLLERHPENIKGRLGLARVLSWSQRFSDAVAEYDRILSRDPRDPLAQRERARVLGWAQRHAEAREGYERLLRDPPKGPEEPLRRLMETIRLEREGKEALWIGRYATAVDLYDQLLRLEPGNEEGRFDRAQALSHLGRWRSAELGYLDLLALQPFHRQAAIARERARLEQRPRGQIQYEFFESRGRGTLADIRRQRVWTSAGIPLAAEGAMLTGEYAHTFFPTGDFELNAYTIRLDGRLGPRLTGFLRATHNDYLAPLRSKQNYEAALDYRPLDRASLTFRYRREDVQENRESLGQQIQRDILTLRAETPLTIRNSVGAAYSYARYSDDNDRQAFELFGSHQFSLYPRVLKLTYTLSYQDFTRATIVPPDGSSIPTVHPYFAPSNFFTNALTIEWRHYLQKELFLGANQCYYDLQWTPAVESIDAVFSNTVRGEVLCDLTRRFTVSVQGLISRSTTYEAEQLSLQLLYRF
ncbi:MAG: tetratricopeptide repeat protein [Candidatus Methylomirabilis oxyfera]|nr:tetratricopeptide repeat protein [Candidatus Methylomirabilis oxyfera]